MVGSFASSSLLVCACAAFLILGAHDGSLGVLLPAMAATYDVSRAAISLPYIGAAIGYGVACLGSPWLVRRLGERFFLALGMGSVALGTLGLSLQPPLAVVRALPVLIGVGAGVLETGWNVRVAGMPRSAPKLNALHACFGVGALLGPIAASVLLSQGWSWPGLDRLLSGLAVLGGLAAWILLPRLPARGPQHAGVKAALGDRAVLVLAMLAICFMGAEFAIGDWNYSFLVERRGLAATLAGALGSGYWLGVTLGRLVLAIAGTTRWTASNWRILSGCLGCTVAGIALFWRGEQPVAMAAGLAIAGLGLGPILPTALALLAERVPAGLQLGAIALVACLGSLGKGILPWLGGVAIDRLGLEILPPYALLLAGGMGLCLWQLAPRPTAEVPHETGARAALDAPTDGPKAKITKISG